jgi:hypothetical protein
MNRWRHTRRPAALARHLGFGHNPLRRAVDRTENLVLLAAFLLAAAVVPFALSFGTTVYHDNLAGSAAQTAARHEVTAVLTEAAPLVVTEYGGSTLTPVDARWAGPNGIEHTGRIQAPTGSPAGSPIRIWNDSNGNAADPPLTAAQAKARGMLAVTAAMLATLGVLAGLFVLVRTGLNRVRAAAWDADWQRVGPRWTTRTN